MKVEYDGRVYDYDYEEVLVSQALKIEEHVGGTLADYEQGLINGRTVCFQAMGWLLFHDGDVKQQIGSIPDFPVVKLAAAYLKARQAVIAEIQAEIKKAEELAETDPTPPPSPSPNGHAPDGSSPAKAATPENHPSGGPTG